MEAVPSDVWLHPALVIATSRIQGLGLSAQEPLAAGTVTWRLGGRVVSRADFDALLHEAKRDPDLPYVDGITMSETADLVLPRASPVHYGNHSCDPSAWWTGGLTVAARRDLTAGEEVTTDYATSTDHADFGMGCACRSPLCRRVVTGDDWRQPELRRVTPGTGSPGLSARSAARTRRSPWTGLIDYDAFCGTISEEAAEAAKSSTISVKDLKAMIDAGKDFYLVDVREPNEFEIVSIPGATLIPKDRILSGEALSGLPQDKQVVLYCKTGQRSAETLAVLKGAGFSDAVHVGGGVIAWANQIDPSLPTY